jgi:hypothetical protein
MHGTYIKIKKEDYFCGTWRRIAWCNFTSISEESAAIFRSVVALFSEVMFCCLCSSGLLWSVCWDLFIDVSGHPIGHIFMGEAAQDCPETSVNNYYWTRRNNPGDRKLRLHRSESPKSRNLLPYILEYNLHPFCSFRGPKNQMRVRIAYGLDSRSRAGFWKNDSSCTCLKNNTIISYFIYCL